MPLTDLVRLLNAESDHPYAGHRFANPFIAADRGVFVHFADLHLRSSFQPIVGTADGHTHGHAATLCVTGASSGQPLDPASLFVLPANNAEFVYLDRLVRTLHALNYLTQPVQGTLLLRVHQRHVLSVPANHGLAFEELLRECGLLPSQVTLEIDTEGVDDVRHLTQAIVSYQSRGYGVAIARFGHAGIDFNLLETIRPDIVRLAPALLASTRPLKRLVDRLHALGARVLIDGVDTGVLRRSAAGHDIDLIQAASLPSVSGSHLARLPANHVSAIVAPAIARRDDVRIARSA